MLHVQALFFNWIHKIVTAECCAKRSTTTAKLLQYNMYDTTCVHRRQTHRRHSVTSNQQPTMIAVFLFCCVFSVCFNTETLPSFSTFQFRVSCSIRELSIRLLKDCAHASDYGYVHSRALSYFWNVIVFCLFECPFVYKMCVFSNLFCPILSFGHWRISQWFYSVISGSGFKNVSY